MTPLKAAWLSLYKPITENLKLDMRMNLKTKKVEIKTTPGTSNVDALQKAADFVHAYVLGGCALQPSRQRCEEPSATAPHAQVLSLAC